MKTANIKQTLVDTHARLVSISDSPRLDAELLLAKALNCSRTTLYTWPERVVTPEQQESLHALIAQRLSGQPMAYVLGYQEFWSLKLAVNHHTLIPRPETEQLVELCLNHLNPKLSLDVLDMGTGCGAIALALAKEAPLWRVVGLDKSTDALKVAKENAHHLKLNNVEFVHSHWFKALGKARFDAIVSNPPYIAPDSKEIQSHVKIYEPHEALYSGQQGLMDIEHIIQNARTHLKPCGWLMIEHGYDQKTRIMHLMEQSGFTQIIDYKDINRLDRIITGRI